MPDPRAAPGRVLVQSCAAKITGPTVRGTPAMIAKNGTSTLATRVDVPFLAIMTRAAPGQG